MWQCCMKVQKQINIGNERLWNIPGWALKYKNYDIGGPILFTMEALAFSIEYPSLLHHYCYSLSPIRQGDGQRHIKAPPSGDYYSLESCHWKLTDPTWDSRLTMGRRVVWKSQTVSFRFGVGVKLDWLLPCFKITSIGFRTFVIVLRVWSVNIFRI